MLTGKQAQEIKTRLLGHLDNFPEEHRKIIKHKVLSMTNEDLEKFIKENEADLEKKEEDTNETNNCIFCAITKKKVKSYMIEENKKYVAILEINPLSKGHTIILPKKHTSLKELEDDILDFAKKISEKISKKLCPLDVKFQKKEVLQHAELELIPSYSESEKLERKRYTDEELEEVLNIIFEKPFEEPKKHTEQKKETIEKETEKDIYKVKPRIGWI